MLNRLINSINQHISYKIHIPIIAMILLGLLIVGVNTLYSLHKIKQIDYSLTNQSLKNSEGEMVSYILLADSLSSVESIVDKAKETLIFQAIVILIIDLLIIGILIWVLWRTITLPLQGLSRDILELQRSLDNKKRLAQAKELTIPNEDEIGLIAKTFNAFIKQVNRLFDELDHADAITQEYLKAVNAGSIVSRGDLQGNIIYVNDRLCEATGYSREELIGQPHSIFRHPNTPKATFREMWQKIQNGEIWYGIFKNVRKDGTTFYANITISPIMDENYQIIEYLALRDDVTELVKSEERLKHSFQTDALTSLGNRFKLIEDYSLLESPMLAILDIRSFKEINDFYGYKFGDFVIIELGNKLFDVFYGRETTIYRLQGDEFAILADGVKITLDAFEAKLEHFIKDVELQPLNIQSNDVHINLTVGLSTNPKELFTESDLAHQSAKDQNISYLRFSIDLKTSEQYKNNLLWTGKVKKALADFRIVANYQPILNNISGKIEKYETLVRLEDEDGKLISPYFFLDIAKRSRLYLQITHRVIDACFEMALQYEQEFSMNLTAEDINNGDLMSYLYARLAQSPVANRMVFEIVESESISSFDSMEEFIETVRQYGCKIAIDDFGTGYSNFEYLMKMQADYIKIDGSMIKNIDTDEKAYKVVETIVGFAKKNQMKTIAEFVSSQSVYQVVSKLGIDYSQGFLFGKPESIPRREPL